MEDPWARIAALAPTLKEAPLRLLIHLVKTTTDGTVAASQRELAEAVPLSRSNVQLATEELERRGLITCSRHATATRAKEYRLLLLETEVLPGRGPIAGPPTSEKSKGGGPETGPQVDLFQGLDGPNTGPDILQNGQGGPTVGPPILRARESIDLEIEKAIDRLLKAKPQKFDPTLIAFARRYLHGYMAKFGREKNPLAPDDQIVAQFLAISEWPRLEGMLRDLMAERKEPGSNYAWFVTVAMQRIWGMSPGELKRRRTELKLVANSNGNPQLGNEPTANEANHPPDVQRAIALAAGRKAMR